MGDQAYPESHAQELFDEFVSASTCRAALWTFRQLCEDLQVDPGVSERPLYRAIREHLNYWRANALWAKLDRRAAQREYEKGRVCSGTTVGLTVLYVVLIFLLYVQPSSFSLSDWSVCGHWGRTLWPADSG